jgi:uncharacterized protein
MNGWGLSLLGGALIGTSASLVLLTHGRVAGISGIFAKTLRDPKGRFEVPFLFGLVIAGLVIRFVFPSAFEAAGARYDVLMLSGLLVGFGTQLGSGCTSGHGVCGISRLSPRSIAATMTFMGLGMATVFVVRHMLGGIR